MKGVYQGRAAAPTGIFVALAGVGLLLTHAGAATGESGAQQVSEEFRDEVRDGFGGAVGRRPSEFYFTRAIYTGISSRWERRGTWAVDHPKADRQFAFGLARLTTIDTYPSDNPVRLSDPALSRYPFLYALEVGYMSMTDEEVEGLRRYLQAGGFLFIDDFWGTWQWQNFEYEFSRVFPDLPIVDLPLDHPLFHTFYDIEEIVQVPSVRIVNGGPTWEQDGYYPRVRGIFDEAGRLMVIINWNTDLGDAWEWVDNPYYPIEYSNYAYQLAVNAIVYAMSH